MAATTTATATNNSSPSSLSLTRTESHPWTQIVRDQESESTLVPPLPSSPSPLLERNNCSSENNENSDNGNGGKNLVWNKNPTNGPAENGVGLGPVVMCPSEAWPALSESTSKASPKISSSNDFGSVFSPQVPGTSSSSSTALPSSSSSSSSSTSSSSVQSQSQSNSSRKPTTSNLNHNLPNHVRPTRQKSMKQDGRDHLQANDGFSHQSSSPTQGSHNHNHSTEISSRDNNQNHGNRDSMQRNGSGDKHHQSRHFSNRGNGGSHSREGSHQNHGGRRRDQDRGNRDWNHQRSFNERNSTMEPRVSPRGFRPPSVHPPFVHPPPIQPTFVNPMGVGDAPIFYLPGVPFVAPVPQHVFIHPALDPELHAKIVNQIDYYFSNENLVKDTYLRQNMDEHGWVSVALIANFKKVKQLTENIQHILDAMRSSTLVEVQGDKIRRRDEWVKWIMPPIQLPISSASLSPKSPTTDTLSPHFQNVRIDDKIVG